MTLNFYEGPLDGRKLDGMVDGTADHIGDGEYLIRDTDGNEVAHAKFSEEPCPNQMMAMWAYHRRLMHGQSILLIISCFILLAGEMVTDAQTARVIIGLAWAVAAGAILIRR